MMFKRNLITIVGVFIVMILFSACTTFRKVEYKPAFSLSDTLSTHADSASIADLPWKVFYNDPYLRTLIDSTLHHNLDLQQAVQNIWIANSFYQQSQGLLSPRVNAESSVAIDKFGKYTLDGKNNRGTDLNSSFYFGFRSSWELDIWKKLRNRKKAAYSRVLASQNGVRMLRTTLVAEVARRYYDLVSLDMKLRVIQRNIRLRESALDIVTIQKEAGGATQLAVEQFKAQLLSSKSLEASILRQIRSSENEINLLAGRSARSVIRIDTLPDIPLMRAINTGFARTLVTRRPDIREAAMQVAAGRSEVEAAQAEFYPSLVLSPFIGLNPFNIANIANPASLAFGIIGGLTAPVFNRLQITGAYNRISEQTKQALINYHSTILKSYYEVRNSINDIEQLQQLYAYKREEADILKNAVDISNDLYVAGYASYLEVILAQRNVVDVELEAISARNELARSYTNLYRSLGGGWQ